MTNKRSLQFESLEDRMLLAADLGAELPRVDQTDQAVEYASIDGTGNNLSDVELGSTNEQLIRLTTAEYGDGISTPAGEDRPSAREISNEVVAQTGSITNDRYLTDITWLFGQFLDHDIDLTEGADPAESFNIEVPLGDPHFDPFGTGTVEIGLNRSTYDETTGDEAGAPRQQINQITAFIDGSVIYGSDHERADALRSFEDGKLKMSEDGLLPFNEEGLENAGGTSDALFLAGDIRANENAALTSMHTLWVREHNRIAEQIAAEDSSLTDEEIYQQARAQVTAQLQAITFNEFLPALLGEGAIEDYEGYDPNVDPSIANIFSTAAYRFGHSMLSTELLRLDNDGTTADEGNLDLASAFFAPQEVINHGIDSLLLGATSQLAQEIDTNVIDDVRNFLFGPPGAGGFDLASLNIQRGRDHGLADYNQARVDLGLTAVTSFSEITSDAELASKLEELYGSVDNIDVWVGGLAEDHLPGSSMGELFTTVISDQFERIRDGDRFWYENVFSGEALRKINSTTLADIIERNTDITGLRENVFFDESVMFINDSDGRHGGEVNVILGEESINVRQGQHREESTSRPTAEVSQVMVAGSDSHRSEITLDIRNDAVDLPGGIVVSGGQGERDVLILRGVQDVVINGRSVVADGIAIDQSGFESIRIVEGKTQASVDIIDDGGSRVEVVSERSGHGEHHQRRDRDDSRFSRGDDDGSGRIGAEPQENLRQTTQRMATVPIVSLQESMPRQNSSGGELERAIDQLVRSLNRRR